MNNKNNFIKNLGLDIHFTVFGLSLLIILSSVFFTLLNLDQMSLVYTIIQNSIAQYAAIEALTGSQDQIQIMKSAFQKRRDFVVNKLNTINGVSCNLPGGAFYVFPNISQLLHKRFNNTPINTPNDLSMGLVNEYSIVTVSGESFGSENNIRLSYATSEKTIKEAMGLIKNAVEKLDF